MTNERETTPPLGFLTLPHIPYINSTERPPVTTTMFATTTPENTLFAYRASTLTDPAPMISPALVEAKHEILESLLRDRRRHIRNEDLQTELEYFSEDYNKELDMEPRPERTREVTLPLRKRSPRVRIERESVQTPSFLFPTQTGNTSVGGASTYPPQGRYIPQPFPNNNIPPYNGSAFPVHAPNNNYPFHTQPMYAQPDMPVFSNPYLVGLFADPTGDNFERSRKSSWDNGRGQRSRNRFSPYRGPNHGLLYSLSKSLKEILATAKLRSQIEEAMRSGQLSYLVKGIKKERKKTADNQRGEKKEKSTTPAEAPILMIDREEACIRNNVSKGLTFEGREITFPPITKGSNSSAPVIIKAKTFGREVGRVHMDSGSSYEVIYKHCLLKLKPFIQASKVDSHVSLVGFLRKKSWAVREVLLEITRS
nr:reverse transcriptase domain-containing protein [Tanacetum cinerariifolium]